MRARVLIVVDNSRRELFGCVLLARCLEALGVGARLCSHLAFDDYAARWSPDAVVWPNVLRDLSSVAERSLVFVLPSESGNAQPELVAMHAGTPTNPAYPGPVTRFFCWGSAMRDVLLASGRWREEQVAVTGSPATDHWLLPRGGAGGAARIGITPTFRALSNSARPSRMNYFEWLDQAERLGGDGTFYAPPQHAESWMFFEASLARVLVGLVRTLAARRAEPIDVRPHPLELPVRYRYLASLARGQLGVTTDGTMSDWLRDKALLFTFMSGSALDAVVRGVPVVSLARLIDADALAKIPGHFRYEYEDMLWPLDDLDHAVDYVERAIRGALLPCPDQAGIEKLLSQHFCYPRPRPAAAEIAGQIVAALAGRGDRSGGAHRASASGTRQRVRAVLARRLPLAAPVLALGRYLAGLRPGQADLGFTYQPWRWRARRAAQACADRVLAAARGGPVGDRRP
jgi:surface carbohydrate biosynthesis protein